MALSWDSAVAVDSGHVVGSIAGMDSVFVAGQGFAGAT